MRVQLLRHATLLVELNGRRFLIDPMFGEVASAPPIPNTANQVRNPMVPLPMPLADIAHGLDTIVVTHLHRDHFDEAAAATLPKQVPVLCQPGDEARLQELGFGQVHPVQDAADHGGIEIVRTSGKHGLGLIGKAMGQVSGFVFRAPGEPSLYIAGDTIWCGSVRETLDTFRPDVVVVNAGAAQFRSGGRITMDAADVEQVCHAAPQAAVIAVHMDAINHCLLSRSGLRETLAPHGLPPRVHIPADGDTLEF